MDLFRNLIDGPYALLLCLQILVVAGLALTLVWLFLYRSREVLALELATDSDSPQAAAPNIATESPAPGASLVSSAPVVDTAIVVPPSGDQLVDLTSAMSTGVLGAVPSMGATANEQTAHPTQSTSAQPVDSELLQAAKQETESLRGKLQFLEGKLLEYEIVQEEIASLSALKMENENLRQEIVKLQREGGKSSDGTPTSADIAAAPSGFGGFDTPNLGSNPSSDSVADLGGMQLGRQPGLGAVESMEPALSHSTGGDLELGLSDSIKTDFPPEPLPDNVLQLSLGKKNQDEGVAEAYQDPVINKQIENILAKLEQLTSK